MLLYELMKTAKSFLYGVLSAAVLLTASAHAGALDEARSLSAQIEQVTDGRVKVLNADADDELFADATAIHNLNWALRLVLRSPDLSSYSAERVGWSVLEALALVTESPDAERRFCLLAAQPCNLFSAQISRSICNAQFSEATAPAELLQ